MNKHELSKKAEDLERQLDLQLEVFKKESESWAKVGGAVLAGGLLAYGGTRLIKGKKSDKRKLKSSANPSINKSRKIKKQKSSFGGTLGKRLFMVALTIGQAKLIEVLSKKVNNDSPK
ncbi:hypothetical protein GCM10007049_10270 [Echinicola pacifica]|uniref:Uncharacterized protein n=1 Tax=Echinicola pacifica TaxID=346377 RepID=A0A918PT66_9BACT|nr:hypothetical protein [Echinicola pacifica]GGZ19708.1 hypothetical protein GCM10007049_10270 [Echinicola pacifica]